MPMFWNSIFRKSSFNEKLVLMKIIEFQWKTRFDENRVIWEILHGTQVLCIIIIFFKVWFHITQFSKNLVFLDSLKHEYFAR